MRKNRKLPSSTIKKKEEIESQSKTYLCVSSSLAKKEDYINEERDLKTEEEKENKTWNEPVVTLDINLLIFFGNQQ